MASYINIRFSKTVGERFRAFSRKMAPSHSKALTILLDAYALMEKGKVPDKSKSVQLLLERSDTNANRIIALLRKIENDQIKPMLGMLQVLFGYSSAQEGDGHKKGRSKKDQPKTETDFKKAFAVIDLKEEKLKLAADLEMARRDIHAVLSKKTEVVKPLMGQPYIKLLVSPEELEALITRYKPKR
ncbi:BfmA/BtgA family mobilization protein [Flagellimonas nanhaiensis]|uniref:Uncharacterized protein n=1 Tax=Flagellimonas nanhaiensis TaxID=2292706 RepID=A0A371JLR4_9FLAO|nr:BfmA/BtgA family mobilization protein [Allomuricauda nanhaiensis]RDY57934.1 hypothetical protein DX873_17465 [Allomuricauda nanhaiensis]